MRHSPAREGDCALPRGPGGRRRWRRRSRRRRGNVGGCLRGACAAVDLRLNLREVVDPERESGGIAARSHDLSPQILDGVVVDHTDTSAPGEQRGFSGETHLSHRSLFSYLSPVIVRLRVPPVGIHRAPPEDRSADEDSAVHAMARRGGDEDQRDCQERSRSGSFHFPLDSSEGRHLSNLSVSPRIAARPSASGRLSRSPMLTAPSRNLDDSNSSGKGYTSRARADQG